MKNLIDPKILAELKQEPVSYEKLVAFLDDNKEFTATRLCKLVGVEPHKFFNWKSRNAKRTATSNGADDGIDVIPAGAGKKRYSADDKLKLVKQYATLDGEARTELMRKYGLYSSDFTRWLEQADSAALAALSTRKPRSDKKSDDQKEIERLKQELRSQEKTIVKLSTIVVAQKKISDILNSDESD